jgi:methylated-DNA-[protein]-cysteine S-methyltransferase
MYCSDIETPPGKVRIVANEKFVVAVAFQPEKSEKLKKFGLTGKETPNAISLEAASQVEAYFSGDRTSFELPVDFGEMSVFAQTVLRFLIQVPYGEIVSYGTLAAMSGRPKAARAVGRIMAANPIPIIVPCHRVVGSSGKMVGYSGGDGIVTKEWLLAFEHRQRLN